MSLSEQSLRMLAASKIADHPRAHPHFWERALSRRQFLAATGLAGGAAVTTNAWMPLLAQAGRVSASPRPIPYGTVLAIPPHTVPQLFHFLPPAPNMDDSSIYDFKGTVGVADISGPGTGTDGDNFGSDNRIMTGTYAGTDGKQHRGTFAFI